MRFEDQEATPNYNGGPKLALSQEYLEAEVQRILPYLNLGKDFWVFF